MKRCCCGVFLALVVLVGGCGLRGSIQGSGNVISENRTVSGFDTISFSGNGRLELDQNGTESLSISADDNILPLVIAEVHGTKLELHLKTGVNVSPSRQIVYKVGARNLIGISSSGDTSTFAKGIHTSSLRLTLAGSGDMSAEGSSDHQEITLAGSARYDGASLRSKFASIDIAGSGKATLAVSDKLDIKIVGDGSIKYIGDPTVNQTVLGSGSISKQ
jgi:hypothetical protein